jgi:hypothetical protein
MLSTLATLINRFSKLPDIPPQEWRRSHGEGEVSSVILSIYLSDLTDALGRVHQVSTHTARASDCHIQVRSTTSIRDEPRDKSPRRRPSPRDSMACCAQKSASNLEEGRMMTCNFSATTLGLGRGRETTVANGRGPRANSQQPTANGQKLRPVDCAALRVSLLFNLQLAGTPPAEELRPGGQLNAQGVRSGVAATRALLLHTLASRERSCLLAGL